MDGENVVLRSEILSWPAEVRGGDEDRHVDLEMDPRAQQVTNLVAGDLALGRVPLALDHHAPPIGKSPQDVSTVVVRAADPPNIRAPIPSAEVHDEVLELRPRHRVDLGKRPMPSLHSLVMPPLPITAPDESIGKPQPPHTASNAAENERTDEIGPDQLQKATNTTRPKPPAVAPFLNRCWRRLRAADTRRFRAAAMTLPSVRHSRIKEEPPNRKGADQPMADNRYFAHPPMSRPRHR